MPAILKISFHEIYEKNKPGVKTPGFSKPKPTAMKQILITILTDSVK